MYRVYVKQQGSKRAKLLGEDGLIDKLIHANMYTQDQLYALKAEVVYMERHNPNCTFTIRQFTM